MGKKALFITLGVILLGFIIFLAANGAFQSTGDIIGNYLPGASDKNLQKQECPYECCSEGTYYEKLCPSDYECISNSCIPLDSDGDGLTNIEEKNIRTDPFSYDTDGDTLGDYQEYKVLGTNPLDKNTDNDRYDDAEDPNPTKINSAEITFNLLQEEGNYNIINLVKDTIIVGATASALGVCTAGTLGACAAAIPGVWAAIGPILDDVIYTKNFGILINNLGDDYASYLNYEVVYRIGSEELKRIPYSYGRINANSQSTVSYSEDILMEDIKYGRTWDLILGKEGITIQIENLDYERF